MFFRITQPGDGQNHEPVTINPTAPFIGDFQYGIHENSGLVVDAQGLILALVDSLPKINRTNVQIIMSELYLNTYFPHSARDKNHPMASCLYMPENSRDSYDYFPYYLRLYHNLDIGNIWKVSLTEFLAMSTNRVKSMIKVAAEIHAAKSKSSGAANAELERELNRLQGM